MLNRYRIALVVLAVGLVSACSARPERFVEQPTEEPNAPAETPVEVEQTVAPLAFIEGEPEVKILGTMGTTQAFQVGGLTVIHKATPANAVVAGRLYIKGGSANLESTNAGIEKLALTVAASGGTAATDKDAFNAQLDAIGADVWTFAERDYSGYGMKTVVQNFDTTWKLFEEAILEPAMPKAEIALAKERQLAEIASMLENPDRHVSYVATRNFFEGHPYFNLQVGTNENVEAFSRYDIASYQRNLLKPENMLLVVVGNVDATKVVERVKARLGRIAGGAEPVAELPDFTSPSRVSFADRTLPTNYVLGYFDAPRPGDPDYPAMVVATEYLRDKLFEEVRTKRNLTYAVSAGIGENRENYGYLFVTATDPKTTMGVIFNQIEEMKLLPIAKAELDQVVNVYLTDHYMGVETNGGQAAMLAKAHLVTGNWMVAETFLAEVRGVTPVDVQNVAKRYFQNYRFGVVGPKANLEESFFTP